MKLTLRQGYYKDMKLCETIMQDSSLYDHYFNKKDGVKDYIRIYYPDEGRGRLYFAMAPGGEAAGLMVVSSKGFIGEYDYLALLGVKKDYRGQGVGSFLLGEFEAICRSDGCAKASLMVSDFNSAYEFYQKKGYMRCGIVPNALVQGIHEYIMLKDL